MVHVDFPEGRFVGEEQPVVEGVAGVDVVAITMWASSMATTEAIDSSLGRV